MELQPQALVESRLIKIVNDPIRALGTDGVGH